jgi:hypothetical protein
LKRLAFKKVIDRMIRHLKLTRRTALAGFAAAGGLMAIQPRAQAFALPERTGDHELAETALSMFSNPGDVRRVGMACQGRAELCLSRQALVDGIFGPERDRLAASLDRAQVHGWLRTRIREDFSTGRTVTVNGWVLADTEAKLYALAAHT